ncbi:MAG: response regulator transcription factor, partial [Ardenticatenales bacterium]|nr:response regulator transcription factor [Ardenticatenales bacterium]
MADESPLSEREADIMSQVVTGASNREIAKFLEISPNTVKVHLRNIFEKLGVASRTEATLLVLREGWVEVEGMVLVEPELPAREPLPSGEEESLLPAPALAVLNPPREEQVLLSPAQWESRESAITLPVRPPPEIVVPPRPTRLSAPLVA